MFHTELPHLVTRLKTLGIDPKTLMLVFDKGNLSEDAFKMLGEDHIPFLCSIRPSTVKEYQAITEKEFPPFILPNEKQVGILERSKEVYGTSYRLLIVQNPAQAEWNDINLQKKLTKALTAVQTFFTDRLNKTRWNKKEVIDAKIRKIIPKRHLPYFDIKIDGEEGQYCIDVAIRHDTVEAHGETLGKTYLLTSDLTTPAVDMVWRYRQQYLIERCFKYLKRPDLLSVRPFFCWTDSSIRGHLFTCVLGLLALSLLTRHIQQHDNAATFDSILDQLDCIKVSTVKLPGWSGSMKQTNRMDKPSKDLYEYLNLAQYL